MISTTVRRALLAGLVVVLGACAADGLQPTRIDDPAEALAMQRELRGSHNFDLSRVAVARLELDGELLEITSLLPATIARSRAGESPAATVFAFGRARDSLILFTRDTESGGAYRLEVPLAEWKPGKAIRFPVVDAEGTLTERKLVMLKVLER